jgi:hypothetical protein
MSTNDDWSPDEPLDTETFESWDEALDREDEVDLDQTDLPEGERELDTQLVVDEAELDELGATLDDPEQEARLDGDMDDPDGAGGPVGVSPSPDEEGWDLDPEDRLNPEEAEDADAEP